MSNIEEKLTLFYNNKLYKEEIDKMIDETEKYNEDFITETKIQNHKKLEKILYDKKKLEKILYDKKIKNR